MLLTFITILLTVWIFKLMDKSKQDELQEEIDARDLEIQALQTICRKYEQEFGLKETSRILTEIENNVTNGDQL